MLCSKRLEPFNRLGALDRILFVALGRFECLQNDILSILKRPSLEPLINKRFDFGSGDLNRHRRLRVFIISWNVVDHAGSKGEFSRSSGRSQKKKPLR